MLLGLVPQLAEDEEAAVLVLAITRRTTERCRRKGQRKQSIRRQVVTMTVKAAAHPASRHCVGNGSNSSSGNVRVTPSVKLSPNQRHRRL